jgi:hypothetical protein
MNRPLVLVALLLSAVPLAAQFTLTPEKAITTPITGPSDRVAPFDGLDVVDVATSGDQLLVVWSERRSDLTSDVFAARLDDNGALLDTHGILVASGAADDVAPRVLWRGGSRYLVVWSAHENGTVQTRAAHIDSTGRVLEPGGVVLTEGRLHSIAHNDVTTFIAVQRPVPAGSLQRSGFGTIGPNLEYRNVADIGDTWMPQVASFGGGFAAVWFHFNTQEKHFVVEWQHFERDGTRVGGVRPLGDLGFFTGLVTLTAGTSGTDAVVAAAGDNAIRVARVSPDGPSRPATGITPAQGQNYVADVGGPGLELLAVVNGILTLYRFDSFDALVSTTRPASLALWGRIVHHDNEQFVAWATTPGPGVANVFSGFLPLTNATLVSRSFESQQSPALATDGLNVLGVWTEDRGTQYDAIVGRRMDRTGTPIGGVISISNGTLPSESPTVQFNGTDYVAVWQEMRRASDQLWTTVISRRVGTNGVAADDVQISPNAWVHAEPATATDGRNVLITWTDGEILKPQLRAAVLAPNRYIMPVSIPLPALFSPAAAWNGESYLIVAEPEGAALRAIVVNRDGGLVSSTDATVPVAGVHDVDPAIAWNGSVHLVVYERGESIHGTFLRRDGSRASADFQLAAQGSEPNVTWDGTTFVVTWERGTVYRDLVAARVTPAGSLLANPVVVLGNASINESDAALLPVGNGRTLVAYQRLAPESLGVQRVFTRMLALHGRERAVRH